MENVRCKHCGDTSIVLQSGSVGDGISVCENCGHVVEEQYFRSEDSIKDDRPHVSSIRGAPRAASSTLPIHLRAKGDEILKVLN
jgi:transcription initiation factor TFIIIB Brf1 subunit/transcription initiation factor TFIIB